MVNQYPEHETPTLNRLRDWLGSGAFAPGDRLPPERELSSTLGVSRAELRKALAILEAGGILRRQIGRGTYLMHGRRTPEGGRDFAERIAARTSPHEAMIARLALEPELAGLAAIHATQQQLSELRVLAAAVRASQSWEDYERLDAELHQAIADAAGNSLLSELHRIVNAVRISVVWPRLDLPPDRPTRDYHSFREHDAILDALAARSRAGAQEAMRAHLKSILATLLAES